MPARFSRWTRSRNGRKLASSERLAYLKQHAAAIEIRDDLVARAIDLQLEIGGAENLKAAYDTLKSRHFHSWEGGYGIHDAWVEVNQKLGDAAFKAKNYAAALERYREACLYPGNLEVAARTPDFRAHVNWNLAKVSLALGNRQDTDRYLKSILAEKYSTPHIGAYYQALAQKALRNDAAATALLDALEKKAREYTSGKFEYRGIPEIIGNVLLSLVLAERGDKPNSEAARKKALAKTRAPSARPSGKPNSLSPPPINRGPGRVEVYYKKEYLNEFMLPKTP